MNVSKQNETQTSGHQDGETLSAASLDRVRERIEWKRRQALQPSAGTLLAPTLPERINRLNPSERHQLSTMIRSLKLRKIVRRTLAEAFWAREERKTHDSMQELREKLRSHASLTSYERALTGSSETTTFEPQYVRSTHGPGNDSHAVRRALEHAIVNT